MFSLKQWPVRLSLSHWLSWLREIKNRIRRYPEVVEGLAGVRAELERQQEVCRERESAIAELERQIQEQRQREDESNELLALLRIRLVCARASKTHLDRAAAVAEVIYWIEKHTPLEPLQVEYCHASDRERENEEKFASIRAAIKELEAEIQARKADRKKAARRWWHKRETGGTNPAPQTT